MKVPTEYSSHVVSEPQGIEEREEVQESCVVRLREPRLDRDCIIYHRQLHHYDVIYNVIVKM